ncbi:MAG: DsbC family protein [Nitrospirae bacterium]|nr:DsbC family protein [Nitrospirota bacterium]
MYKRIMAFVVILLLSMCVLAFGAETPEEALKKAFPDIKADSMKETLMKGIYEIVVDSRIAYFHPESGTLIIGKLIGKDGKDITKDRMNEIIVAKVKDIPLDKAIKIGSGKNTVIEFTDPDCPYCRQASEFLSKRNDVTRYVFLSPIAQLHPKAEEKAKYILCSKDRVKTFEEVLAGKHDDGKYEVCKDEKVDALLKEYFEISQKIGIGMIYGTPFLVINGTVVQGANIPVIQSLLENKKEDAASKKEGKPKEGKPKEDKPKE